MRVSLNTYSMVAAILSVQTATQAINLLIGLLIVRNLGVQEYAIYAIAGTLAGIGVVLANMSLYQATSYRIARAAHQRTRVATIVATASRLQNGFIPLGLLGVTAVGVTYRHQFSSDLELGITIAIILLQVAIAARLELARSILYAQRRARPVVLGDTAIAVLRLSSIVPMLLFVPSLGAIPVLFANAIAQLAGFATLRTVSRQDRQQPDRRERRELLRYMAPLWPEFVYYLLQGNVALIVLAWVGTQGQVAELGALTRLVQVVIIFAILNRLLVQPYVARYASQQDFRSRGLRVLGVYAAGGVGLMLLAWLSPDPFLLILGHQYEHLTPYVLPAMAMAVMTLGCAVADTLCMSSGRPGRLSLTIPLRLGAQIGYILLVGLGTVGTALGFMLLTATAEFVVRLAVFVWLSLRPGLLSDEPSTSGPILKQNGIP